jgi:glycosyltransferase involved in cell wall biosynthesis
MLERVTYRKAKAIAIPSQGLGREMRSIYAAETDGKVTVISNPVDTARMARPAGFDPATVRAQFGFAANDFVMTFIALGHYERKGLPLLLEAMARLKDPRVKLLVVGGQPGVIQDYTARADTLGIKGQIAFTGFQKDVRPYLWASDVFAFPSYYEVFSLVTLEAAAAGLPLVVSHLNGVEEMLVDGENGWYVERDPADIAAKIRYCAAHPEEVRRAGQAAVESVRRFDVSAFVARWREYYAAYEQRFGHENPAGS